MRRKPLVNQEHSWYPVKDGADLFAGLLDITDGAGLDNALDDALDIGKDLFEALEHSVKAVKFAANLKQKWSKPAWERDAITFLIRASKELLRDELRNYPNAAFSPSELSGLKDKLAAIKISLEDVQGLTLNDLIKAPIAEKLLTSTETLLQGMGFNQKERRTAMSSIRANLRNRFESLVTQPRYDERTKDLRWALKSNEQGENALETLREFKEYQRRRFTEIPLSVMDPFPLQKVFVDLNAVQKLRKWIEDPAIPKDKYSREPETPTRYRNAYYLRGPAGSGKSSVVRWMANEIAESGGIPITILMRDVSPGKDLLSVLDRAISRRWENLKGKKLLNTRTFEELASAPLPQNQIFLILDGLDEIQIGTGSTFQESLIEFFKSFLDWHLDHRGVRVLVTTRPGVGLQQIHWPDPTTAIELEPLSAHNLAELFRKIRIAIPKAGSDHWRIPSDEVVGQLLDIYRTYLSRKDEDSETPPTSTDLVHQDFCELLSLPQLATLAYRELGFSDQPLFHFLHSPTDLYEQTIDRAVQTAAKFDWEGSDHTSPHLLRGDDLRTLLVLTAIKITLSGTESISRKTWEDFIRSERPEIIEALEQKGYSVVHESLVASFYFRQDDNEGGCEFVHKSFREFLFAEGLVKKTAHALSLPKPDVVPSMREVTSLVYGWISREIKQHINVLLQRELSAVLTKKPTSARAELLSNWMESLLLVDSYEVVLVDEQRDGYNAFAARQRSRVEDLLMTIRSVVLRLRLNHFWPVDRRSRDIGDLRRFEDARFPKREQSTARIRALSFDTKMREIIPDHNTWIDLIGVINCTRGRPGGNFPAGWEAGGLFPEDLGVNVTDTFWCTAAPTDAKMQGLGLMFNRVRVAGTFWNLLRNATYYFGAEGASLATSIDGNNFLDCVFIAHQFVSCRIYQASFRQCALQEAQFNDCCLSKTSFHLCNLNWAEFSRCGLFDVEFDECETESMSFDRCQAIGGKWPRAMHQQFDFSKPVLLNGVYRDGRWTSFKRVAPR